ncbi:MAG TPA: polyphosphate kinase 2, partial [Chloroflexota bacterium]
MPKKKDKKKDKAANAEQASVAVAEPNGSAEENGSLTPMSRKEFERKLKPLHVELVKLQLWAQHAGLRV